MDRRRQTVGGEESADTTQQVRDAHTDEEFIEQIKADEVAMNAAQNEDGGEA